ncbi:MAG: L,D-transpeptidase family protein [Bacillota bacterium]
MASFYAARAFQPLWSVHDHLRPGAFIALELLRTADLDGLDPAKYLQTGIERAVAEAARGDQRSVGRAELLLSRTFGQYVRDVRRPRNVGAVYTEPGLGPAQPPVRAVLQALASAPSLETYLRNISWMHPIYGQLRSRLATLDSDPGQSASGEALLLRANMDRASILPAHQDQYILVDTAAARLDYFDAGELRKTMRVIVGSPDHPTPMMVGMIRYATLNPYWHVPPDLTRERIAPRVLSEGLKYFRGRGYEVVSEWSPSARVIDPSTIDWKAVAAGRIEIFVRQKPGPQNGMGKIKLRFPNDLGIYLHDTPAKELFVHSQRNYSGGCVRLDDAPALGTLLLGRSPVPQTDKPEQTISLTHPIPLYITYLTLRPEADGKLVRRRDVYGRDQASLAAAQDQSSKSRMR